MGRAISIKFMDDLKSGKLSPLLSAVHNDTTLIMELRGNKVTIYYRGGVLFDITEPDKPVKGYSVSFNSDYWGIKKKYDKLVENPSVEDSVKNIALYKDQMDFHFANAKRTLEKQCQQRIVLENNVLGRVVPGDNESKGATTGDYFILDTEYAYKENNVLDARFDAVALKWPSLSSCRRKREGLGISFIEVKYNDGAMRGDSGIQKHIDDYLAFIRMEEFHNLCRDMEKVFRQKCGLGLIPAYTSRLKANEDKYYNIGIDDSKVEFIFIFANHDPDSGAAKKELLESINKHGEEATNNIYVATASEMGYVMFRYTRYTERRVKDNYIPISEYVK